MTRNQWLRRLVRRGRSASFRALMRLRDQTRGTLEVDRPKEGELLRIIPSGLCFQFSEADFAAVRQFIDHRFDLLGSGWVQVRHGMTCAGFEGVVFPPAQEVLGASTLARLNSTTNEAAAGRLRGLLSPGYQPIDWHLDFKSGFRWSERTWYRDIRHVNGDGIDIKVPWELSRMQHLTELALAYSLCREAAWAQEFCDQVLDWIAANPPRFGVNWACTMDVAIRLTNWLIAFDILRAAGARFTEHFGEAFLTSVWSHARHIVQNLEWSETHTANHYLANVCGLLIAAAYLPSTDESDGWLLLALQELMVETRCQFLDDGGHYEASTAYHALCAEMISVCAVWIAAIPHRRIERALRVGRPSILGPALDPRTAERVLSNLESTGHPLSSEFFATLTRAAYFSRRIARPDGSAPLIGDNDSGRFLRLGGWVHVGSTRQQRARFGNLAKVAALADGESYIAQASTAIGQWLGWVGAVQGDSSVLTEDVGATATNAWTLGRALLGQNRSDLFGARDIETNQFGRARPRKKFAAPADISTIVYRVSGSYRREGVSLFESPECYRWDEFGVYVVRTRHVHLVIRCGWALWDNAGTHAHEDQLSFDLTVDGVRVAEDPGNYVYTPSPRLRCAYRRASAHFAPATIGPDGDQRMRLFSPPSYTLGVCLEFRANRFVGRANVGGGVVTRTISFSGDRIEIVDVYQLTAGWRPASEDPFRSASTVSLAPNYGWRVR